MKRAMLGSLLFAVGMCASTAQASVSVHDAATAPAMVTVVMSRSEISAADRAIGQGPKGTCMRDDKNIAPLDAQVLPWIAANTPKVHLTGSIETGVTRDTTWWCAHYGETIAPSWTQLESFASQYGMHFISHSADYPLTWTTPTSGWTGTLADWQSSETCGSRDVITQHGLPGAAGQFDWPNQLTDPTVMANDVIPCFFMNRTYQGTGVNTLASVQANQDIASTRQLLGGRCNVLNLPCSTPLPDCSVCRYTVPISVINQITALQPGQALNLQAYVLVRNSNPTNALNQYVTDKDQWDCTNPNPAYHWSNDAERYCWVDFQRIIRAIQNAPNVVVTDPEGVAQAWGMSPPTR